MDRAALSELHYITAIANVASIVERGLMSHRLAERIEHRSVAMPAIQARRARVLVPGGSRLHDYVNLYFNGRNPMMYTVVQNGTLGALCLLRISCGVLDLAGVVIADCNASSEYVRFAGVQRGLALIDGEEVFAKRWTHDDPTAMLRHKSRMCAEVLVPRTVHPDLILGAYAPSDEAQGKLRLAAPGLAVTVDRYKFFQ